MIKIEESLEKVLEERRRICRDFALLLGQKNPDKEIDAIIEHDRKKQTREISFRRE